jgi:ubiquinone/menaquinone biosynthesis C-methylase UbiE
VHPETIELLKNPHDNTGFILTEAVYCGVRVQTGRLTGGGRDVPIRDCVPRFVSNEAYAASFGYEWNSFRQTQLDSFTGTTISRDRWIDITTKHPEEMRGKVVVEAGSGSGRFLEVVAPHARRAIGIDMSVAVDAARENLLDRYDSVDLIQADLNSIPLKDKSVDFLYSIGVLHHIPDTLNGIKRLMPCVKRGGEVAVWLYGPTPFSPLPLPSDLYRFVLSRTDPAVLLRLLRHYVPFALKVHRLPFIGKLMKLFLPVSEYPRLPIPENMRLEWYVLDAFDRFATRIEKHFTEEELRGMLTSAGLGNIRKGAVYNSFIGTKL